MVDVTHGTAIGFLLCLHGSEIEKEALNGRSD